MRFKDKVVLVTGAGSGIGRGIAACLGEEGAFVVLNDIRQDAAEESRQILAGEGHRVEIAISDISTPEWSCECSSSGWFTTVTGLTCLSTVPVARSSNGWKIFNLRSGMSYST